MKKNLLLVSCAMLLVTLASCGSKDAPKSENLFNIQSPSFEKLVVVTGDETEI